MKLPVAITKSFAKAVLKSKQNSPHLFFGAGLGAVGLGTVLACKGTLKVEPVIDQTRLNVDAAKARGPYKSNGEQTKAVAIEYAHGGIELIKLYGPSMLIGGLGVAALTGSHIQLTRRNTALMGSLAASMRAFQEYRGRVAEEIGKSKELDLYRGLENQTVKNEDGTKELVKVRNGRNLSEYARCFDESARHWQRNSELNRAFVTIQEQILDHDLKAKGYVTLNDAYRALGFEETAAGQQVGWVLNGVGDGFIDFGLHEVRNAEFTEGNERSAWLDFNVDGPILHYLKEI